MWLFLGAVNRIKIIKQAYQLKTFEHSLCHCTNLLQCLRWIFTKCICFVLIVAGTLCTLNISYFQKNGTATQVSFCQAPFSRVRNRIVPFRYQNWDGKVVCSHGDGTIRYRSILVYTRIQNCTVPRFSRLRNSNVQVLSDSEALYLFTRERERERERERYDCVTFQFSVHFLFRPNFWNDTARFEAFPCERNPSLHQIFEWNDTAAYSCQRGLSFKSSNTLV